MSICLQGVLLRAQEKIERSKTDTNGEDWHYELLARTLGELIKDLEELRERHAMGDNSATSEFFEKWS